MNRLVYIQGPAYYSSTLEVFEDYGFSITRNIQEAEGIVLTGGEDINPAIYGEQPHPSTYFDIERDVVDMRAAEYGLNNHRFLIGICRGGQLLNCMNGGKLVQDIPNHENGEHEVYDFVDKKYRKVISIHHQEMIPESRFGEVIAAADLNSKGEWKDIEVVWYDKSKSFCFQSHPEFGYKKTSDYFFELLERYWK